MISKRLPHGAYRLTVPGEGGLVPARPADAGGAHHDVGSGLVNGVGQAHRVAEVAHNRLDAALAQCTSGPLGSGQSQDLMASRGQRLGGDRAEVAGGAGDKNLHGFPSRRVTVGFCVLRLGRVDPDRLVLRVVLHDFRSAFAA